MDVFNHHHHHHHQQFYNMPYYYPNEILYPDYNAQVLPSDFGSYQIYNYEKPVENSDFYLYSPESPPMIEPEATPEIEDILRSNEEVWDAYQTGKFKVNFFNEGGHKKLILREETNDEPGESEYKIRRFKVLVTTPRNSRVKDDHVLLVSFSQKSLGNCRNTTNPRLEIDSVLNQSNSNLTHYQTQPSEPSHIMTGPGSELINKIINGEDESFIEEPIHDVYDQGEYEPAYEIQTSPSKTSSRFIKEQPTIYKKQISSRSSQASTRSRSSSSESENYIDEIINKIKNAGRESQIESRLSQSNVSRSQFSGTPASLNAPFSNNVPADPSINGAGSLSYMGSSRYIGADSQANTGNGSSSQIVQHYQLNDQYADESMGHVSRSSTRNHSIHEQVDTHSIGPGSMAGGSLFGGYIPGHVEHTEKSAFSEYNLTKNEDGDYVLREANGKSEIFDGKSGLSKSVLSRSQLSKSNLSRFDDEHSNLSSKLRM